jgi:hypothetical protein
VKNVSVSLSNGIPGSNLRHRGHHCEITWIGPLELER